MDAYKQAELPDEPLTTIDTDNGDEDLHWAVDYVVAKAKGAKFVPKGPKMYVVLLVDSTMEAAFREVIDG